MCVLDTTAQRIMSSRAGCRLLRLQPGGPLARAAAATAPGPTASATSGGNVCVRLVSERHFHRKAAYSRASGGLALGPGARGGRVRSFHATGAMLMAAKKDFYEVLGVPRNASKAEIKKKYFELAKKYHPVREISDEMVRGGWLRRLLICDWLVAAALCIPLVRQDTNKDDPTASKKFVEITEAYEVLGDETKRKVGGEGAGQAGSSGLKGACLLPVAAWSRRMMRTGTRRSGRGRQGSGGRGGRSGGRAIRSGAPGASSGARQAGSRWTPRSCSAPSRTSSRPSAGRAEEDGRWVGRATHEMQT